jgi:hypothetical protein
MTPQQYIEWFDAEIAKCKVYIRNKDWDEDVRTHQYGRLNGLWDAKNQFCRFIALQKPSQPTEPQTENNFTDGFQ